MNNGVQSAIELGGDLGEALGQQIYLIHVGNSSREATGIAMPRDRPECGRTMNALRIAKLPMRVMP
jgi:hypothetical protein